MLASFGGAWKISDSLSGTAQRMITQPLQYGCAFLSDHI